MNANLASCHSQTRFHPKTQWIQARHAFLHRQVMGIGIALISERGREDLNHAVGQMLATNGTGISGIVRLPF